MNLNTALISCGWFFVGVASQDPLALPVLYYWKFLTYDYDSTQLAVDAEQNGDYDFRKSLPLDIAVAPGM